MNILDFVEVFTPCYYSYFIRSCKTIPFRYLKKVGKNLPFREISWNQFSSARCFCPAWPVMYHQGVSQKLERGLWKLKWKMPFCFLTDGHVTCWFQFDASQLTTMMHQGCVKWRYLGTLKSNWSPSVHCGLCWAPFGQIKWPIIRASKFHFESPAWYIYIYKYIHIAGNS